MSEMLPTFTSKRLEAMLNDARLFQAELHRFKLCETADAELDRDKRLALRRDVVEHGFMWKPSDLSAREVDLLYGMAREAARIALARRSAKFRAEYGITLTCGDPPAGSGDAS